MANSSGPGAAVSCALLVAASMLAAGCAGAGKKKESRIHFEAAQRFDRQGDFVSAREEYRRALLFARSSGADRPTLSLLTYNYARTAGYTCALREAEKYLLQSLEMERAISGPQGSVATMRMFELARFYFDQAQYDKSVAYYDQGLPYVEYLGIVDSDPIGFADALHEYSVALAEAGRAADAAVASQKALQLRQQYPGAKAGFLPNRYKCRS